MPEAAAWRSLGQTHCCALTVSRFRLDGGAMFGLVPRPLWAQKTPPDAQHRVPLACNSLLVRHGDEWTLIDSGCGDRFTQRQRQQYDLQALSLASVLQTAGIEAAAITRLVLTHLHFDHVGGAFIERQGTLYPTLPNARIYVQRGEWQDAVAGRSIMKSSYRPADLDALEASGRLHLIDGDADLTPYLSVFVTGGHTQFHQGVLVRDGGQTLAYAGELIPTRAHINPHWNMAYDMFPYQTLERKQAFLEQAVAGNWLLCWDHDPECLFSRLHRSDQGIYSVPAESP